MADEALFVSHFYFLSSHFLSDGIGQKMNGQKIIFAATQALQTSAQRADLHGKAEDLFE